MLFGPNTTVREQIVVALARHGAMDALELLHALPNTVTVQAIYQELRRLLADGAVIKAGRRYALRLAWVTEFQELASAMNQTALASLDAHNLADGDKRAWIMRDMPGTLNIWAQLTFSLLTLSGSGQLLEWAPHALYHLVKSGLEEQFLSMLKRYNVAFYLIVGDDTPLDRSYSVMFHGAGKQISFSPSPFAELRGQFFSVIGDYIIRVKPAQKFMDALDRAFQTSPRMQVSQVSSLTQLLNRDVRVRVELHRSAKQSRAIRRHFTDYFGPLASSY